MHLESVVHGWDRVAQHVLEVGEAWDNSVALWGSPVNVAPDATLLNRILAITGRVP